MSVTETFKFDFRDPAIAQDPHLLYRRLLDEPTIPRVGGVWLVSRHEDCNALLKHPGIGRRLDGVPPLELEFSRQPLGFVLRNLFAMQDPPEHTRIRGALSPYFSRAEMAKMQALIVDDASALIERMRNKTQVDLMEAFAVPLPFRVISAFLGIPSEYHARLVQWVHELRGGLEEVLPPIRAAVIKRANSAAEKLYSLFNELVSERERRPGDDLLSKFSVKMLEGVVSREELISGAILMLPAGTQTTLQTIGNSIYLLLRHDQHRQFVALSEAAQYQAVEELLRYESPVKCLMRTVKRGMDYQSQHLRRGEPVCFFYGAANRDPRTFLDPDRLDLARTPNKQVAFSAGPHHCLGLHLGRLEVRIALKLLFEAFPTMRLTMPLVEWEDSFFSRQLLTLPVSLR